MRRLMIVGAGEFGREVFDWVTTSPAFLARHEIGPIEFLDDEDIDTNGRSSVRGAITGHNPTANAEYLCAIGNPEIRQKIVTELEATGANFLPFVHDSVRTGNGVSIGAGSIVCPGTILTSDILVGRHVHLNLSCTIGHDVVIEDFVTVSPSCNLTGGVKLERGVFLGTAVTIIPQKTIGRNSRIGAGSVVLKSIRADVTAFGNPCKVF